MRSRAGLISGVLIAVATGAVAVPLGITLLLVHIVDLRRTATATLRTTPTSTPPSMSSG